ncbi:MAG: ABC transporter ATP-binding protein [Carbonactinosporaceae bacterium]
MITFDSVTKRFPDGTVAVHELSLEIPTGATTVFVGPSGCGKTTSLRMINRMLEPTAGRILLDDQDILEIDPPALRRRMGYVIQQAGLFPHRKVVDNVATVPYLLGWSRKDARAHAMGLLERVGLDPALAQRYPHQLSGGQQQRVGVARALAADPPVLLMDEPFSAVDPVVRQDLQDEFLRLQQDLHKTIVFVTHDVDEAIKLGDRIAVLRVGGHLAQVETPERLLASPKDPFVESFIGKDRGIRRLSFIPAAGLPLSTDIVVAESTPVEEAREIAAKAGTPWLLVVDPERRPLGWFGPDSLPPGPPGPPGGTFAGPAGDGALVPYGHTFRVDADSLRAALDSAVLSPSGLAVGVDADGRVAGVVGQAEVGDAIRAARRPEEPVR